MPSTSCFADVLLSAVATEASVCEIATALEALLEQMRTCLRMVVSSRFLQSASLAKPRLDLQQSEQWLSTGRSLMIIPSKYSAKGDCG